MNSRRRARIDKGKALKAWSTIVRSGGRCEVCGRTEYLQAHHLLDKNNYPTYALDPMNGICLCAKCHKYSKTSFHKNAVWASEWLKEHQPVKWELVKERI